MVSVASISSGESLRRLLRNALPGAPAPARDGERAATTLPALYAGPHLPALPFPTGR